MRLLITICLFISVPAHAVTACMEHGYCAPQGTVHIQVSPKIPSEHQALCDGASFNVQFSVQNGQPIDVVIQSGPEPLRAAMEKSFKQWRFGAIQAEEAEEKVVLKPDCSLEDWMSLGISGRKDLQKSRGKPETSQCSSVKLSGIVRTALVSLGSIGHSGRLKNNKNGGPVQIARAVQFQPGHNKALFSDHLSAALPSGRKARRYRGGSIEATGVFRTEWQ